MSKQLFLHIFEVLMVIYFISMGYYVFLQFQYSKLEKQLEKLLQEQNDFEDSLKYKRGE